MAETELLIDGMSCASCAQKIEDKLSSTQGVSSSNVNFATKKAYVKHDQTTSTESLESVVEGLGYKAQAIDNLDDTNTAFQENRDREKDLKQRFFVALFLTIPIFLLSMVPALRFEGYRWIVAVLSTIVIFWVGWVFHRSTIKSLRHGTTTMDTLVTLGTVSAWVWSTYVVLSGSDEPIYYETGAVIITLILLGKYLEASSTRRSGDAIRALADLSIKTVTLDDGSQIPLSDLKVGMRFVVKPGQKIATDGLIVDGNSSVDNSMITGESMPVEVVQGDEVIGSTVNMNGSLTVEATKVGADTMLSQIMRLVEQAQSGKAKIQRLADRISSVFVPVVIFISIITFVVWLLITGDLDRAITSSIAVLIISCPCALGLATPLAIMVGTGRGAQLGIIIKGPEVLEDSRLVDSVVLDKTGTLTYGNMEVSEVISTEDSTDNLVKLAASLEAKSEHPIAQAISTMSSHSQVEDFENTPGFGVSGVINGVNVSVGKLSMFDSASNGLDSLVESAETSSSTIVYAGIDKVAQIAFVIKDIIKPTSKEAVGSLKKSDLNVILLTGDNKQTAESVASKVGIDNVISEVLPDEKASTVKNLQDDGARVAMVGDGVNDAPALAQADLGISVGTGTDVAIQASDVTIVSGDLRAVNTAISLARKTLSVIKGNLFWAFAYNVAAIPLAMFGVLNPMIASGAMSLSSLFVVFNSLRLRNFSAE